ncbi:hypothetical protein HDU76_007299 [Blyttiomyces sp. JEL0837]|nr:hypothetical protein HDU76_007299 [Blyttiomyces sp. JEL0837]
MTNGALPIETNEEIIIYLHPHELHRLARVSKTFHSICMKPSDSVAMRNLSTFLSTVDFAGERIWSWTGLDFSGIDLTVMDEITIALKKSIDTLDLKASEYLVLRWLSAHGEAQMLNQLRDSNRIGPMEMRVVALSATQCRHHQEDMMTWIL